ncbi:MAG: ABC transporter ATP-binding protein [Candidatus Eremiobacterota bacterium]
MNKAIKCTGITKYFYQARKNEKSTWNIFEKFKKGEQIRVLNGINFTVRKGEIYGILGPNGSGKSTLIRIISTLLLPDEGEVTVYGLNVVTDCYKVRHLINRVSVEAAFFKKLTVMENILFSARLYGMDPGKAVNKASEILKDLDFSEDKINESVEDLSRGQQQKVAIARALLTEPRLLLLDEPTTGLDPKAKKEVQKFILGKMKNQNVTVILTTHDMEEADKLCDRIAIIKDGHFIAEDTPEGLKRKSGENKSDISLEDVFLQLTEEVAA